MADLGSLTARIGLDTTPLAAGAALAKGELSSLESSGSASLNKLASVGKAAFLGLSAAGAAVGIASIKMASDFEASMTLVRTQSGASQAEVESMTQAILDMAQSVGTSPQKLADALFHIEAAGIRGSAALDLLRIAAQGAKVGQADLEAVTNALVAVTTSHIGGVHTQAEAMGVLNAIVGVGNMRMDDLAKAIGTGILPVARSFGLSLQDVGAAMAVLTDQAIPAEVAATRLRTTFALMAAPTTEAVKQLARLGISSTDLAEAMRHGGIVEAIGLLKTGIEKSGLSSTEAAQLLNKAFGGGETSGTILTLLGNFDSLVAKQKAIGEGAGNFSDAWAATKETFKFQMDQMKAAAEVLAIRIGNFLIPTVVTLVKALGSAVEWLGKHKDVALALAAVVGGPLLAAMTAFLATEIAAAAPVLLVGAAIAALSAGFVLAYQKIGPFHDAVNGLGNFLKSTFLAALNATRAALDDFLVGFSDVDLTGAEGKFARFGDKVQRIFEVVGPAVRDALNAIVGFITDVLIPNVERAIRAIQGPLGDFVQFFRDIEPDVREAITHVVNVIRAQLQLIGAAFAAVFLALRGAWRQWGDDIVQIVRNIFNTVKAYIDTAVRIVRDVIVGWLALINGDWRKAWDAFSDIPKAVLNLLLTIIRNGLKLIGNVFDGAWDAIYASMSKQFGQLVDFMRSVPGRILDGLQALPGLLTSTGRDLMQGLLDGIKGGWVTVSGWATGLPGAIRGWVSDAASWLLNAGQDVMTGLWNGLKAAWNTVSGWGSGIAGAIPGWFSGALSWLGRAGQDIMTGLWNGLKAAWNTVSGWGSGIIGAVGGWFGDALSWLARAGQDVMTGLWNGLKAAWNTVSSWASGIGSAAVGWFAGAATWLFNAGVDLIVGLLNGMISAMDRLPGIVDRFTGLDVVLKALKSGVDALQGAKIDITAAADTTDAEAALDRLIRTMERAGGVVPGGFRAAGGLVTQPELSVLGEGGRPELVLPLTNQSRMRELMAQHGGPVMEAIGGAQPVSQSSTTQYILQGNIVAADPAELERQLEARARLASMAGGRG